MPVDYKVIIYVDYKALETVPKENRDYPDYIKLNKEDNLKLLKIVSNEIKKLLDNNKDKYNFEEYSEFSHSVGSSGIADAFVNGAYQAVDIDDPSFVSFEIKIKDYTYMNKLKKDIIKLLPKIEKLDKNLCFYSESYDSDNYEGSIYVHEI